MIPLPGSFAQFGDMALMVGLSTARLASSNAGAAPGTRSTERASAPIGIAAKRHRQFADLLDQVIGGNAFLLADRIPQNAAKQTDILNQREILVCFAGRGSVGGGVGFAGGGRGHAESHS